MYIEHLPKDKFEAYIAYAIYDIEYIMYCNPPSCVLINFTEYEKIISFLHKKFPEYRSWNYNNEYFEKYIIENENFEHISESESNFDTESESENEYSSDFINDLA